MLYVILFFISSSLLANSEILSWFYRVLDKVDFDRRFEQLPQFVPESADMSSPLPQSPRAIISNYRKRGSRKVSSLGK